MSFPVNLAKFIKWCVPNALSNGLESNDIDFIKSLINIGCEVDEDVVIDAINLNMSFEFLEYLIGIKKPESILYQNILDADLDHLKWATKNGATCDEDTIEEIANDEDCTLEKMKYVYENCKQKPKKITVEDHVIIKGNEVLDYLKSMKICIKEG